jgi:hypothetical protein
MSSSNLFLCFFGDGPYWKDFVYIPAYPAGFSYQKWAFRYTSEWVASAVNVEAQQQQQKKIQISGILGVRFSTKHPEKLLPLRKIEVTWIDLAGGITQFYFRVQALLDFTKFATLENACLTIPPEELATDGQVKSTLAFKSSVATDSLPWCSSETEGAAWGKLLDLIEGNVNVGLKVELKSATYFRFSNISDAKTRTIQPTELEVSQGKGPIYGALLKEGREYKVQLSHRILGEAHDGTAPILPLALELPTTNLQLTEPALEVVGWYQTTPIVFKALRADQAHQVLVIRSDKKKGKEIEDAKAEDGNLDLFLPIPLRVSIGWLYRLRTNWALRIGLAVVLTIQASLAYFKDFMDKLLEGKASLSDLITFWPVFLLLFALGAVASIFVTLLSGGKQKE